MSIAICIPAYNAAEYLPRLLRSAQGQAFPFNEILVYDDCSTDDTARLAERWGARVIQGDVNRGCSYGKNRLAEHSSSEWLHFHDADDDLLPAFTTLVGQWIKEKGDDYDILLLNFDYVDANTGKLLGQAGHNIAELHQDPLKYAITHKIVNFGVYKRDAFLKAGGFDLDDKVLYNEDNAFHQRLARLNYRFEYLPEVTCINYRYGESMSASNVLKCAQANFHVLEKTAVTHGIKYPAELSEQLWNCVATLAACGDWIYVRKALDLSRALGYRHSPAGNPLFKMLTHINPFCAVKWREKLIRLFKPHLRNG
ncbi:glycosyltransferase family 2 protein [Mucilaginibacter calamicampi]|uniref:Glycosyltransferase family 2 protein n=1 Tax=Mucilaginibacter calamicampi TaxID=1302352 RepID=A0ABW2YS98_9SPHI